MGKLGSIFDRDLFEEEGIAELQAWLREHDALDVLRTRVVSVVKKAGALAMDAQIEDNRLVILLETLMP